MKRSVLVAMYLLSAVAVAQNTCSYTITKPVSACFNTSGTLVALNGQSMNEGWSMTAIDTNGVYWQLFNFPGLGWAVPADSISQPNGPGTLPLSFSWTRYYPPAFTPFVETVTSVNSGLKLTVTLHLCKGCIWVHGTMLRGVYFNGYLGSSATSALAYDQQGFALQGPCPGVAPDIGSIDPFASCTGPAPALLGTGVVYSNLGPWQRFDGDPGTQKFTVTYKPF